MRPSFVRFGLPSGVLALVTIGALSLSAAVAAEAQRGKPRTAPAAKAVRAPLRLGAVVGLREEKKNEYLQLHANTWPAILRLIRQANIRNYSIYMAEIEGKTYLFASMEYHGDNYERDMARLAKDPVMEAWWRLTDPCQFKLTGQNPKDRWMNIPEVFHTE